MVSRNFSPIFTDDVLFLTQQQQQQQQLQQQRQSQTSTPDVALQSQMISHRMQATTQQSVASHRSSYHQQQPQHPRASQVSSVRLSNISSGGSSDLDSRKSITTFTN